MYLSLIDQQNKGNKTTIQQDDIIECLLPDCHAITIRRNGGLLYFCPSTGIGAEQRLVLEHLLTPGGFRSMVQLAAIISGLTFEQAGSAWKYQFKKPG